MKMRDTGLSPISQLIRRAMQVCPKKDSVRNMACGRNGLSPKLLRCRILIKHRPGHLDQGTVLPLHDAILLWDVRRRELVLYTCLIAEPLKVGILELRAIVTESLLKRPQKYVNVSSFEAKKNT